MSQAAPINAIVYQATNRLNGHRYIGFTTQGLEKRQGQHLKDARGKRRVMRFQRALLKYGPENFEFSVMADFQDDEELAKAASVHLRGARAWRRKKEDANLRRLEEARTAIDGFDIARAKSLLLRIEDDYLTPESSSLRDGVLLDLEARSMESESLQASADQIIVEHLPRWKRWLRRRH